MQGMATPGVPGGRRSCPAASWTSPPWSSGSWASTNRASRRSDPSGHGPAPAVRRGWSMAKSPPPPAPRSRIVRPPPGRGPTPGSPPALLSHLLARAIDDGASDLHLEPGPDGLLVRARVDGVLRRMELLPEAGARPLLSRLKVVAGMDIAVRRRPQDGGFPLDHRGRELSIRASTLPVDGGEKAVLRVLDPRAVPPSLDGLGLADSDLERLRHLLRAGRGVILAAGPTGSGKSSTLFGALGELDRQRLNVVTLEDPIEYRVPGVNQVQVHPRAGLTFPSALRSVLRQDPDVVMVGEIRDGETAEIAMAAAVTGHLVLSTVHTTDAPGAITRLLHMGVPRHLVAGGLAGVVAQRLLRTVCTACGGGRHRSSGECRECRDGLQGRTGVFEVLTVSERLRDRVMAGAATGELRRQAREDGMGSMADDARRKVACGDTTPHEVARVLHRPAGALPPCSHCGSPLPDDARACPGCALPTRDRCRCGRVLQPGWRFCPACARPRPPAHSLPPPPG
ncbi:MAG: type II/IV secretion system protein [Gemmatimonadales bacterium]|nr:MAG: type II/IV secretion system protein [Gemmatimonadales bacterium]